MKRIALSIITLFICVVCYGATFNQYWYVGDNTPIQTSCTTGGDIILPTPPTKYGYDFIGWEKLPYIPIEYLESTGTQYIDTGVILKDNYTRVVLNIEQYTPYLPCAVFIGSTNGNESNSIHICSNTMQINAGVNHNINMESISQYSYVIDYLFDNGSYEVKINNNIHIGRYDGSIVSNASIFLFAFHERGNATHLTKIKLSETKIYSSSGLMRDFIPVLDEDGTPCMYDKVEQKFYYNAGTGDFIAGPVIGG